MAKVTVTMSDKLVTLVDDARGEESRASYVRRQVEKGLRQHPPTASLSRRLDEIEKMLARYDIRGVPARQTPEERIIG